MTCRSSGYSIPSNVTSQPCKLKHESNAFAAAITLIVAIPILIALIVAIRHKWTQDRDPVTWEKRDMEGTYWERWVRRPRVRRFRNRAKDSAIGRFLNRWIYCPVIDEEMGESLRDPAYETNTEDRRRFSPPASPTSPAPIHRRDSLHSQAMPPYGNIELPRRTIPTAGPFTAFDRASAFPQMEAGAMGGGGFVQPARPRHSTAIAPLAAGINASRRGSIASRDAEEIAATTDLRGRNQTHENLNENIPLAMPVRASQSGHRRPPAHKYQARTSNVHVRDSTRQSNAPARVQHRNRRELVTSLLSAVREGQRAPRNTEADDRDRPVSPFSDGPQEQNSPRPPRPAFQSPLDQVRRTRAMNRVIQESQNFIGGYPDIACLIGELPAAGPAQAASHSRTKKKARTTYL